MNTRPTGTSKGRSRGATGTKVARRARKQVKCYREKCGRPIKKRLWAVKSATSKITTDIQSVHLHAAGKYLGHKKSKTKKKKLRSSSRAILSFYGLFPPRFVYFRTSAVAYLRRVCLLSLYGDYPFTTCPSSLQMLGFALVFWLTVPLEGIVASNVIERH